MERRLARECRFESAVVLAWKLVTMTEILWEWWKVDWSGLTLGNVKEFVLVTMSGNKWDLAMATKLVQKSVQLSVQKKALE
jgi:hypothetical protein